MIAVLQAGVDVTISNGATLALNFRGEMVIGKLDLRLRIGVDRGKRIFPLVDE